MCTPWSGVVQGGIPHGWILFRMLYPQQHQAQPVRLRVLLLKQDPGALLTDRLAGCRSTPGGGERGERHLLSTHVSVLTLRHSAAS
jgi:hypothetical protein